MDGLTGLTSVCLTILRRMIGVSGSNYPNISSQSGHCTCSIRCGIGKSCVEWGELTLPSFSFFILLVQLIAVHPTEEDVPVKTKKDNVPATNGVM